MLLRCRSSGLARLASEERREFHRAVDGFGAAIRKKDAVHAGPSSEFASQWTLIGIVKEIREVNGTRGFAADDLHDARMSVAEGVHSDAAKEIEILFSGGIKDVRATAVSHDHRLALVSGQEESLRIVEARIAVGASRRRRFCFLYE